MESTTNSSSPTRAAKDDAESLNNITTDTSAMNLSMDSTLSNTNNVPSKKTTTEIDPDIDVAAEQIVNDFTDHLNQRIFPSSVVDALMDDDDDDGAPVVGVMSTSLPAGGFEELIVGLDDNSTPNIISMEDGNAYNIDDDDDEEDDDDVEEEEVIDSSYEEEILDEDTTEVEFMDDVDIEEIMEESGIIIAEDKKQLQEDNGDNNSNDNDIQELTRDESIHGVGSTDTGDTGLGSETVSTNESKADTTNSSSGNEDSLAVSESTRNTQSDEHHQPQQQSLYGDALLGDMSEMTMGSRTDPHYDTYKNEPPTNSTNSSFGPHSRGNLLSPSNDDDTDDGDTFVIDSKKNENDNPMASAATLTAAVAAAAAEAAIHGDPAMKSRNKSMSSSTVRSENSATPTDYSSSHTNTAPVPPALQYTNNSAPVQEQDPEYNTTAGSTKQMSVPPALQRTPSLIDQEQMSTTLPGNNNNSEIPVPPALSGPPSQGYVNENDIEMGGGNNNNNKRNNRRNSSKIVPEMAQQSSSQPYKNDDEEGNVGSDNQKDETTTNANKGKENTDDNDDEEEISEGMNLSIYASIVLCLAVVFLVVMLSVFLTRNNNDSGDRDVVIPSPAPIASTLVPIATAPVPPPTTLSEPPTILSTWTNSINPVLGAEGSNFGTSISIDDSNMWSVGAPQMSNTDGVDTGGVVSATFVNGSWVLLPDLLGENSGDMFGKSIDLSQSRMIVGAPMSLIANTSTPAGSAYYYANITAESSSPYIFRSADDLLSTNGEFGQAVAIGIVSDTSLSRVAIGAPGYNTAFDSLENGRVYTYGESSTDATWSTMEATPIVGSNAYDWFGFSVDMTKDGSRFIVGAPGSNSSGGYFQIYEWDGTQWNLDFEDIGYPGDAFGSYVTIISEGVFAVGGPGYNNESGRVVMYQRSSNLGRAASDYTILGEPIIGVPGDRLGAHGSIAGGKHGDDEEMIVIVSTAKGSIQTYSFDELAGQWEPHIEALSTGKSGLVSVEYSTSVGLITGYPDNVEVSFYTAAPIVDAITNTPVSSPAASSTPVAVVTSTMLPTPVQVVGNATMEPTPFTVIGNITMEPTIGSNVTSEPPMNATTEGWVLVAEAFSTPLDEGSGYGSSVSMTDTTLVVGASLTLGNGAVLIYMKNTTSSSWTTETTQELFGMESDVEYGAAVDVSRDDMLLAVGAPRTLANGTFTEFGAVYCYAKVDNGQQYEMIGDAIRGEEDIYSASEMFGSSVTVASTGRIAVGAPFNNLDMVLLRGRVYLFDYNASSSSWERIAAFPGQSANSAFGTSIDMSTDGTQLIVGAPGTNYAEVYFSVGSQQWNLDYVISSSVTDGTTGFGTLVIIITNNLFAVSDPNFNSNQGRVVIYKRDGTNTYGQSEIIGTVAGSQFGTFITGMVDVITSIPSILIGGTDGSIVRYDSDGSDWVQHPTTLTSTSFGTAITSMASSSNSNEVVVTGTQNAAVYRWS